MKKIFLAIFIAGVLTVGYLLFSGPKNPSQNPQVKGNSQSSVILFYGETCPHCKKVEEWLAKNPKIEEKSGLVKKEVYYNQENSKEMVAKAKECQVDESQGIGVPFLYDKGRCIMGDQLIINYLSSKYQ